MAELTTEVKIIIKESADAQVAQMPSSLPESHKKKMRENIIKQLEKAYCKGLITSQDIAGGNE